jgi:phospholipid/cholesterol/gamma-HCH transport system ATP-binding protein
MSSVSSAPAPNGARGAPRIEVADLAIGYGGVVIQRGLEFSVGAGQVFVIMGGSGSGKSTLLRSLIGLQAPLRGEIRYDGRSFWQAAPDEREQMMRRFGVLYQRGALWTSMTLAENVALPLREFTDLDGDRIAETAALKLALVGLKGFEDFYPAEISGGMQKRAGLARAMALDPDMLFLDEPSAGLDPITAKLLDDLILELRDSLGQTIVVVSHDLASIFAIAGDAVFLDEERRTQIARGNPKALLRDCKDPKVRAFLTREAPEPSAR